VTDRVADDLAGLSSSQRTAAEALLHLRARAIKIAKETGLEPDDVFRMLRHLGRSPEERLVIGLRHGRLRPDPR
jgi:hypothetical protein